MGSLENEVVEVMNSLPEKKSIVFTDILGGSAFNTAMKLQQSYDVLIVAGVNLMMLLDVISIRDTFSFEQIHSHLTETVQQYISIFPKKEG